MLNDSLMNRTYPDAYIDHWGRVYLLNPAIRKRGVLFETFLIAPEEILILLAPPVADVDDYRPLLAAQRQVKTRVSALGNFTRDICNLNRAMHG